MNTDIKQQIAKALTFDALAEAEKVTGKSYKEDKTTESSGLFFDIYNGERKARLMDLTNDTKFSETEDDYLKKAEEAGFEVVLKIPFTTKDGIVERFYVMFHYKYSILLKWDTYTCGDDGSWAKAGKKVPPASRNGGSFYYNWSPKKEAFKHGCTSSGGFVGNGDKSNYYSCSFNSDFEPHLLPKSLRDKQPKWCDNGYKIFKKEQDKWFKECDDYFKDKEVINVWSGEHDCREALKFNINRLSDNGTFLKKWKEQPFIYLVHHGDTEIEGYSYGDINGKRISMLPKHIQEAIGVK
jgi:hypothetical protein